VKITGILLNFGYVEGASNSVTCLDWTGEPFATPEEAIQTFFKDLRDHLTRDKSQAISKCCKATLKALPDASYCCSCRKNLVEDPPDQESFIESLQGLATTVDDSSDDYDGLEEKNWVLFGGFKGTYVSLSAAEYFVSAPKRDVGLYDVVTITQDQLAKGSSKVDLKVLKGLQ